MSFHTSAQASRFVRDLGFHAPCGSLNRRLHTPFVFSPSFTSSLPLPITAEVSQGATRADVAYRVYVSRGRNAAQLLFNGDPTFDEQPPLLNEIAAAVAACDRRLAEVK